MSYSQREGKRGREVLSSLIPSYEGVGHHGGEGNVV